MKLKLGILIIPSYSNNSTFILPSESSDIISFSVSDNVEEIFREVSFFYKKRVSLKSYL